ncbi:MAG: hypothetical protein V4787_15220 [Pseudomonadota bacterium]
MGLNNLIIFYELIIPDRNQSAILATLRALGPCTRIRSSVWHLKASLSAQDLTTKLRNIVDRGDSVLVLDATNDNAAWYNIDQTTSDALQQQWRRR